MAVEKLRPSFTFTEDRLEQLKTVVPEAFADGKIDWDTLREALGEYLEDEDPGAEHFGLTWPGKREARRLASRPSTGALIPLPGEGVNEETTRNVFIEGENLEVLKLLQKSYTGRVKMIYIDPPYNRGDDLIYKDEYAEPLESYLRKTNEIGDAGELLTTNSRADGRFHSNWLTMMYPRLLLARNLLRDDGILMASISDVELPNLRQILNEIFGEENFLAIFIWANEGNIDNQSRFKRNHEYIVVYARDEKNITPSPVIDPNIPKDSKLYRDYIENTIVKTGPKNPESPVTLPIGFPANFEKGTLIPKDDVWPRLSGPVDVEDYRTLNEVVVSSGWSSKDLFEEFIASGFQPVFDSRGQETIFYFVQTGAIYLNKRRSDSQSHVLTILNGMGTVQGASATLADLGISFDYPKPTELMDYLLRVGSPDGGIVLDFFAGSGGLGHAVIELNHREDVEWHFILVQLPEPAEGTEFGTISELCEERLRRVALGLSEVRSNELPMSHSDIGFRSYRLDRSNFKTWQDYDGVVLDPF